MAPLALVRILFNHPLVVATLDTGNWFVRLVNQSMVILGAVTLAPNRVQLTVAIGAPDFGPDVVSFSPPPFDVLSNTARQVPAEAFTDFPIT